MKYALVEITGDRIGEDFWQIRMQSLTKSEVKGIIKAIKEANEMLKNGDYDVYGKYFATEDSDLSLSGNTLFDYSFCRIIPMWDFDDFLNE